MEQNKSAPLKKLSEHHIIAIHFKTFLLYIQEHI